MTYNPVKHNPYPKHSGGLNPPNIKLPPKRSDYSDPAGLPLQDPRAVTYFSPAVAA